MANIYTKTMREALQEARDYREPTDIDEGYPMSYDEWLKKEKGIKKGAHGINSDEHAKYSAEWRASVGKHYDNLPPLKKESNLDEIVGGRGEMTVTKDGGVMIIKTKDWQTYKAKGWNKKEEVEEGSFWGRDDLVAKSKADDKKHGRVTLRKTTNGTVHGITTADKAQIKKYKSQGYKVVEEELDEDCGCGHGSDCDCPSDCDCGCNAVNNEEVELTEGRVIIATDKKTKKKWQFSGGMKIKWDGKTYSTEGVSMQQVLELTSDSGGYRTIKLGKKDIEDGFASGTFSVVNDGSVYQPWKN